DGLRFSSNLLAESDRGQHRPSSLAHLLLFQDSHVTLAPGEYHVVFDNTHSMLRKKTVRYQIAVTEPIVPSPTASPVPPPASAATPAAPESVHTEDGEANARKDSKKEKKEKKG